MRILLVRHAHAGARGSWTGPGGDLARELTERGQAQSVAVAARWVDERSFVEIASSEAVRCVQTVEPLAAKLGMKVTVRKHLLEGSDPATTLAWLVARPGHTIASSHGDVIGGIVHELLGAGVAVRNADGSDVRPRWQKAATWELHVKRGEVRSATYHAPPT